MSRNNFATMLQLQAACNEARIILRRRRPATQDNLLHAAVQLNKAVRTLRSWLNSCNDEVRHARRLAAERLQEMAQPELLPDEVCPTCNWRNNKLIPVKLNQPAQARQESESRPQPHFNEQVKAYLDKRLSRAAAHASERADPIIVGGRTSCSKCGEHYSMADIHECKPHASEQGADTNRLYAAIMEIRDHVKGFSERPPSLFRVEEMCDAALSHRPPAHASGDCPLCKLPFPNLAEHRRAAHASEDDTDDGRWVGRENVIPKPTHASEQKCICKYDQCGALERYDSRCPIHGNKRAAHASEPWTYESVNKLFETGGFTGIMDAHNATLQPAQATGL